MQLLFLMTLMPLLRSLTMEYSLNQQSVTALAVDGGDRKWMATKDGIWIFDRNVATVEQRFTAENSPLPSNNISEFAYDQSSGEMFILTDRGLVSYRSASSAAGLTHGRVKIFPNPIRPQDSGPVSITGLAQDVNIKITDVQGNLIKERRHWEARLPGI